MKLLNIFSDIQHDIDEFNYKLSKNNKQGALSKRVMFMNMNDLLNTNQKSRTRRQMLKQFFDKSSVLAPVLINTDGRK